MLVSNSLKTYAIAAGTAALWAYVQPESLLQRIGLLGFGIGSYCLTAGNTWCQRKVQQLKSCCSDALQQIKALKAEAELFSQATFTTMQKVNKLNIQDLTKEDRTTLIQFISAKIKSCMTLECAENDEAFNKEFYDLDIIAEQILSALLEHHKGGVCKGLSYSLPFYLTKSGTSRDNFQTFLDRKKGYIPLQIIGDWDSWGQIHCILPKELQQRFDRFDEQNNIGASRILDVTRSEILKKNEMIDLQNYIVKRWSEWGSVKLVKEKKQITFQDKDIEEMLEKMMTTHVGNHLILHLSFGGWLGKEHHAVYCYNDGKEFHFFDSNQIFFSFSKVDLFTKAVLMKLRNHYGANRKIFLHDYVALKFTK